MTRRIALLTHTGRAEAVAARYEVVDLLRRRGLQAVVPAEELDDLGSHGVTAAADAADLVGDAELVVVLGGDGTVLRAAEVVREHPVPLLGVNLGHVGFLAEIEREDLAETVDRVAACDYVVEERMTVDVDVVVDGEVVGRSFALNEASVEKASRERMLELVLEVDGRPVSTMGCDGVVVATPTGSTAYAFSAGGPVIWPEVEALLMVPISGHALFSRPLVTSPGSVVAVEVLQRNSTTGTLWCDGRRTAELPPGARIEVRRGAVPVRLARLSTGPFTDRLVAKFRLPVTGWRGPDVGPDVGPVVGGRDLAGGEA